MDIHNIFWTHGAVFWTSRRRHRLHHPQVRQYDHHHLLEQDRLQHALPILQVRVGDQDELSLAMGRKPHLTSEQANEVREMYSGPWTVRQIAHFFHVSTAVIHAVLNRTGAYAVTNMGCR